jgi:pyruvate kinase
MPIIAFTPTTSTYRQLALCWGVAPCLLGEAKDTENMFIKVIETAMENHLVAEGDKVVITSGVPIGTPGSTSLIKVHTIGQPIES